MRQRKQEACVRLLKYLVYLAVLAVAVLIGYTYLGDMSPRQSEISQPVTIEVN